MKPDVRPRRFKLEENRILLSDDPLISRQKNEIITGLNISLVKLSLQIRQRLNLIDKHLDTRKVDSGKNTHQGCLFPIGYGVGGVIVFFLMALIAFLAVYFDKIRLRQKICWDRVGIFAFLGVIPYVRYLIIHHHVWYHYFFTYRAQAATVMALCFAIAEVVRIKPQADAHGADAGFC